MAKAKFISGLKPDEPVEVNARIIARTRLDELYVWEGYVDNSYHVHELHNLRIAAKRLRYTFELFADVLPEACEPLRVEVENIQEELGALHDSDVMIALLRLCLGSLDGGEGYMEILARAARLRPKGDYVLHPELLTALLDSTAIPSAEQRQGLELVLNDSKQRREEQYRRFRQHWYQLQERNFRSEVLTVLGI